jgi:hypothetical protein
MKGHGNGKGKDLNRKGRQERPPRRVDSERQRLFLRKEEASSFSVCSVPSVVSAVVFTVVSQPGTWSLEPGTSFSGWNAGPLGENKEVRGGPGDPPRVD